MKFIKQLNAELTPEQLQAMRTRGTLVLNFPVEDQNSVVNINDETYIRQKDGILIPAFGQCPQEGVNQSDWICINIFTYEVIQICIFSDNGIWKWSITMEKILADMELS